MVMDQQDVEIGIFERIRKGKPDTYPLPEVPMYDCPGDPRANFITRLLAFDGRAVEFKTREDALRWLKNQPAFDTSSQLVYSSANGLEGNVTEDDLSDLHDAHKINTCLTEGEIGVGEMGAIWVTDASLIHTACALFSRQLFILLDSNRIFSGLHQAYANLKIREHQYGSFYTGPSATADIEAVHITGAQGPLGLTALIYNCEDAPDIPKILANPHADTSVWVKSMEQDG